MIVGHLATDGALKAVSPRTRVRADRYRPGAAARDGRPRTRLIAFVLGCLGAITAATPSQASQPGCEFAVRITPQYDARPRSLAVELSFPAEGRSDSQLVVNEGWSGIEDLSASLSGWRGADASTRVEATGRPDRWRVVHSPRDRATVAFLARASLADPDAERPEPVDEGYRTQIGKDWFQFFGYSVLPTLAEWDNARQAMVCITVVQPGGGAPLVDAGHAAARGAAASVAFMGTRRQILHAFYAGGNGWRTTERPLTHGTLRMIVRGRYAADDATLAGSTAALIDTHRRFWGDASDLSQTYVVTPNHGNGFNSGTVVANATVLHVGSTFAPDTNNFRFLIGHENLHQWNPLRLGAISTSGDQTTTWLAEGFTNYYTNRLLLASGQWTREQYASALTRTLRRYWQSPARNEHVRTLAPRYFSDREASDQLYTRGELLAMRWDRALREAGHTDGIDAVMRGLLLPPGTDIRTAPLVTERLFAALTPLLGDGPREDTRKYADEGADFPLVAGLAGPCFAIGWDDVPLPARPAASAASASSPAEPATQRLPTLRSVGASASDAACVAWLRSP